jgi:transposase
MGRWALRRRDAASFEERRMNGIALLPSGLPEAEAARLLGVTPVGVCHWKNAADGGGRETLRALPLSGRPPLIARDHQAALPEILVEGALAYGFSTDLWTTPRIVKVAEAQRGPP